MSPAHNAPDRVRSGARAGPGDRFGSPVSTATGLALLLRCGIRRVVRFPVVDQDSHIRSRLTIGPQASRPGSTPIGQIGGDVSVGELAELGGGRNVAPVEQLTANRPTC